MEKIKMQMSRAAGILKLFWAGLLLAGTMASAWAGETASGRLVNGFRVLSEADLAASADILVFRGDYIKFEVGKASGVIFSVPALDIEASLVPGTDSPYFKMKQVGGFEYALGRVRGILRVVEYEGAHYQALTAQGAKEVIENIQPLILDVRTPGEYRTVRIEDAKLLPVQLLQQNLSLLSAYKEEPVLIYCATGNRSTVASKILIDNGFKRVFNLKKGIKDWVGQGLPVVNSSP